MKYAKMLSNSKKIFAAILSFIMVFQLIGEVIPSFQLVSAEETLNAQNAAAPIIVDDGGSGYTEQSTVAPKVDKQYSGGYKMPYNGSMRDFNPGENGQFAKYTPNLTENGEYDIYVYAPWANENAFTSNAVFLISYLKDGKVTTESKSINQKLNGMWRVAGVEVPTGSWYKVGTYQLAAGEDSFVQYINKASGNNMRMITDAVAFVPAGQKFTPDAGTVYDPGAPSEEPTMGPAVRPSAVPGTYIEGRIGNDGSIYYKSAEYGVSGSKEFGDQATRSITDYAGLSFDDWRVFIANGGWVEMRIYVEEPGRYKLDHGDNYIQSSSGFKVSVNGAPAISYTPSKEQNYIERWDNFGSHNFEKGINTVRFSANSGYLRMDLIRLTLEESAIPYVKSAKLSGESLQIGETVTAVYEYGGVFQEKDSSYQWYSADSLDSEKWEPISGAAGTCTAPGNLSLELNSSLNGKYVRAGIIPKNDQSENPAGTETFTNPLGRVGEDWQAPVITNLAFTGKCKTYSVLKADYLYSDINGELEEGTEYQWLISEQPDSGWSEIAKGTTTAKEGAELLLLPEYANKYITFKITPKNSGVNGQGTTVEQVSGKITELTDNDSDIIIVRQGTEYQSSLTEQFPYMEFGKNKDLDGTENGWCDSERNSIIDPALKLRTTGYHVELPSQYAQYQPKSLLPGKYKVFTANYGKHKYEIQVGNQLSHVITFNGGNEIVSLGEYIVGPGEGITVKNIRNNTSAPTYADLMIFELVEKMEIPPEAEDIAFTSGIAAGMEASVRYSYKDITLDSEGGSVYTLYYADKADGAFQSAGTGTCSAAQPLQINIPKNLEGKYIKVGIIPKNNNPADQDKSKEAYSEVYGPVASDWLPPVASNVTIDGRAEVGAMLTGQYQYDDANFEPEAGSVLQWSMAESAESQQWVPFGDGQEKVTLTSEQKDKYIRFSVVPKNAGPNGTGTETVSQVLGPVGESTALPEISSITYGGQVVTAEGLKGAAIGGKIDAAYVYTHIYGLAEDAQATQFQWYRSFTPEGEKTPIEGANSLSYTPTGEDSGNYLRLGIIPASSDGKKGTEYLSEGILVKWKLSFYDEFDYEAKDGYDPTFLSKWVSEATGRTLSGIQSVRIPENLEVTDGKLLMHTRKETLQKYVDEGKPHTWTTASIYTREKIGPAGYYEASYKYAYCTGLNQSFWAINNSSPYEQFIELDFNEGHFPREIKTNLHYKKSEGAANTMNSLGAYPLGKHDFAKVESPNFADDFHKFAGYFEMNDPTENWDQGVNADNYRAYSDDKLIRSTKGTPHAQPGPVAIWFSIAVYPGFGGPLYEPNEHNGVTKLTAHNSTMEVEYVRFYEPLQATKKNLEQVVQTAKEYIAKAVIGTEAGNYPQSAVDQLESKIPAAEEILQKDNPAQTEIDTAISTLNRAIEEFLAQKVGDRNALLSLISTAEQLLQTYPSGTEFLQCAPAFYAALEREMKTAKEVTDMDNPTQSMIDERITPLDNSIKNFYNGINYTGRVFSNQTIDLRYVTKKVEIEIPANFNPGVLPPAEVKNDIVIIRQVADKGSVQITIPKGAQLEGEFKLPSEKQVSVDGYTVVYGVAMSGIKVKNGHAIRIALGNSRSCQVGISAETVEEITKGINEDSERAALTALGTNKAVKYSGAVIVIYTKELADYVVYRENTTPTPTPTPTPTNDGGNWTPGTSGGGIVIPPNNNNGTDGVKFTDIAGHWAEKEIIEMAKAGVINGRSETEFAPEETMTRAEYAALIRRAIGLNLSSYQGGYGDVDGNAWYANEIQAIVNAGIMIGDAEGTFRPEETITRQEAAKVIVTAYLFKMNIQDIANTNISFYDSHEIAGWAAEYVQKAVASGLMNGMGDGLFAPAQNMTRAQGATIIARLLNKE